MFFKRTFASLVLAEHNNSKLNPSVYSAVHAAEYFNDDINVLVAGDNCNSVADEASRIKGVAKVYHADSPDLKYQQADSVVKTIQKLHYGKDFKRILAASSNFARDVIPRLGGVLDVQPITEIVEIMNIDCYKRAAYAGNAIYTVTSVQKLRLFTIRPTSFESNTTTENPSRIEKFAVEDAKSSMKWISEEIEKKTRPDLSNAKVVVSGGRGLKNKEGFGLAEQLGDALGAAIGASRAAVDANYCNNDLQVGQTGKIVAPELYIAIGISGAIQHLAGMKDSKVIVAINNDPEAPIFSVADYGLVADAFKAVPELISKLKS